MREEPKRVALHPDIHDILEDTRARWESVRPGLTYSMVIEVLLTRGIGQISSDELRAFKFVSLELGRPRTRGYSRRQQPTDREGELGSAEETGASRGADADDHAD